MGNIAVCLVKLQAPLYRFIYAELGLGPSRLAFTCHNFEPQGKSEPEIFTSCGLNVKGLIFKDLMKDDLAPNKVNLLKVRFLSQFAVIFSISTLSGEGFLCLGFPSERFCVE